VQSADEAHVVWPGVWHVYVGGGGAASGGGGPASGGGGATHVEGRSATVLPRQSSHSPQSFAHIVDFVHRGHAFWSPMSASEQSGPIRMSTGAVPE
jgi:hypothetical protein